MAFRLRIGKSVDLRQFSNLIHARVQKIPEGIRFGLSGLVFQPFVSRLKFLETDNQKMFHAQMAGIEVCHGWFGAGLGAAKSSLNRVRHAG
ncbi:MAG TPA: hypothetical protein VN881_07665 [Candidatus Acidoferrales bacterium]|nr:hypothetical protein [Candidatus Acidoferrales bacterium]